MPSQKTNEDMNILLNVTDVLMQHPRYHHIYTHTCTTSAMRQATKHTLDYVDAAMTSILSPDILPVEELRAMLRQIKSQLPLIIHLPISLDNTPFLLIPQDTHTGSRWTILLIHVHIQDRAQQLQICEIFNLPVPHGDVSAKYEHH